MSGVGNNINEQGVDLKQTTTKVSTTQVISTFSLPAFATQIRNGSAVTPQVNKYVFSPSFPIWWAHAEQHSAKRIQR